MKKLKSFMAAKNAFQKFQQFKLVNDLKEL